MILFLFDVVVIVVVVFVVFVVLTAAVSDATVVDRLEFRVQEHIWVCKILSQSRSIGNVIEDMPCNLLLADKHGAESVDKVATRHVFP